MSSDFPIANCPKKSLKNVLYLSLNPLHFEKKNMKTRRKLPMYTLILWASRAAEAETTTISKNYNAIRQARFRAIEACIVTTMQPNGYWFLPL